MRRLLSEGDILAACDWRLASAAPAAVAEATIRLSEVLDVDPDLASPAVDEIAALLTLEGGRAGTSTGWTAVCAVAAPLALAIGNQPLFWRAGVVVLEAHRQAQRGRTRRGGDALEILIAAYVQEMPEVTPAELWADFTHQAEDRCGDVLIDFDATMGLLSYANHDDAPEDIGFEAFRRRVQRARKKLLRQEPVGVAPAADHRRNQLFTGRATHDTNHKLRAA